MLVPANSWAAEDHYRIEILVFRHLESESPGRDAATLRDFTFALDLLPGPELMAMGDAPMDESVDDLTEESDLVRTDSDGTPAELPLNENEPGALFSADVTDRDGVEDTDPLAPVVPYDPWSDVVLIEDMGDEMRESWRRLRLSRQFRPLQFIAWEQSPEAPYPTMRTHNADLIHFEDPWHKERASSTYREMREAEITQESEETGEAVGNKDGVTEPGTTVVYSDTLTGEEAESAADVEAVGPDDELLPEPSLYFSVDGTSRLRKSRFLHLELDLEFRQPQFSIELPVEEDSDPNLHEEGGMLDESMQEGGLQEEIGENQRPAGDPLVTLSGTVMALPVPDSFLVHSLRQSRQIKTMRMEYFDSPTIGVLAWITPIEVEEPDTEEGAGNEEPQ
jgi:hypothetical protein